jgi:hypothetical protein
MQNTCAFLPKNSKYPCRAIPALRANGSGTIKNEEMSKDIPTSLFLISFKNILKIIFILRDGEGSRIERHLLYERVGSGESSIEFI